MEGILVFGTISRIYRIGFASEFSGVAVDLDVLSQLVLKNMNVWTDLRWKIPIASMSGRSRPHQWRTVQKYPPFAFLDF